MLFFMNSVIHGGSGGCGRPHGLVAMMATVFLFLVSGEAVMAQGPSILALPQPTMAGAHTLPELLRNRRSVRDFTSVPLTVDQLGQLLWAAQGITTHEGLRTAPSAGALYPLELYVVAGNVKGLPDGIYHYEAHERRLLLVEPGDNRLALAAAAFHQAWIAAAPVIIVLGAVRSRTIAKYGSRSERYVAIEAGHAAENLFLQAEDMGLGTCDVGAFEDEKISRILLFPRDVAPLLLMPVGHPPPKLTRQ